MKREVALAVVVGALAGLAGAWSARTAPEPTPGTEPAPAAAPAEALEHEARAFPSAAGPARRAAEKTLLRIHVTPPAEHTVSLSRWALRAGKGSDGEWLGLPDLRTNAAGEAQLETVPGSYWVSVQSAFVVTELSSTTDVNLTADPGVPFSGRVVEKGSSRPLSGAVVTAGPADAPTPLQRTALADGLGRYQLDGLAKGAVVFEVSAPGYRPQTTTFDAPGTLDFALEKSCRVDGKVIDGAGASVSVAADEGVTALAREDGSFFVDVDCDGAELLARDAQGRVGHAKVARDQRTVTISLSDGAVLHGLVHWAGSAEPLANAELAALTGDDQVRARTVSDAQGRFTLGPLLPGNYIVRARKGRGTAGAVYGIDVPTEQVVELAVDAAAALDGLIIGAAPDENVDVELVWPSGREERPVKARTTAGRFHFEDLPPGAATVKAMSATGSADARVFLTAGATAQAQLTLEGRGRIVGRVNGQGRQRARVVAFRHYREGEVSTTALAEADGSFAMAVPRGEYRVGAHTKNQSTLRFDSTVTVVEGQDSHVDLELQSDGGEGWGPMASVARGEVGGSFENVSGSVQVTWLISDSPLAAAGMRVGDLITAIDGQPVHDSLDAFARTRGVPGGAVAITYRRDGSERTVTVARAQ